MTIADSIFINNCRSILNNGVCSNTRAKWNDNGVLTTAQTKHIFGVTNRYDLSNGNQFPLLTLRKINWKNAMDEILWIWQKNSNNINDLNSHIWDSWADDKGSIGKSYGYQLGKKYKYKINGDSFTEMTQLEKAFYDLKNNPDSRRIIVSMWNVEDLKDMHLEPCAYSMTFNVIGNKLNAILNQRSQDMLTAGNWNVVQYSILLMMIANHVGLEYGVLLHVISDCHIYDRHIEAVKYLINNYDNNVYTDNTTLKNRLIIGKDVILNNKDFFDVTIDDLTINGYEPNQFNYKIPVAI